ncbi:hypothetical protein, partial [Enterobacter hormaechei]|uniref:hypothetical protein n=1 Tax=Enterobacter hormaechei TaxID=158836 RepID=UPI0013D2AFA8
GKDTGRYLIGNPFAHALKGSDFNHSFLLQKITLKQTKADTSLLEQIEQYNAGWNIVSSSNQYQKDTISGYPN